MNKMGIYQRLWCLMITVVLLLTAASVYPESKDGAARANGTGDASKQINTGIQVKDKLQNGTISAGTFAAANQQEVLSTGRAILKSRRHESVQAAAQDSISVAAPASDQIITSLKVTATGYTAGYESTGKTAKHPEYGITYSGVKVRRDKQTVSTIAADPRVLPLGSILYVPGYGYAIVADTGSAIKGRKIDLYFATTKQVYKEWGKKTVVVQLIKRGNGKCTEAMLKNLSRAIQTYKAVPQSLLEEAI